MNIQNVSLVRTLRLCDLMENEQGWGHTQGLLVAQAVRSRVEADRSLISFAREVVQLAASVRSRCGFCLTDVSNEDMLLNWHAAALIQDQPLFAWNGRQPRLLGEMPSAGLHEMLYYVLETQRATTSVAAQALNLKVQNASNKLSALWRAGYVLRLEQSAQSGGTEHEYLRIG